MRTRKTVAVLTLSGAAVAALAQAAAAGSGGLVTPHMHYIDTPGTEERVPFGPDACGSEPGSGEHIAFSEFHWHIHKGPVADAVNHEHNPVTISAGGCPR